MRIISILLCLTLLAPELEAQATAAKTASTPSLTAARKRALLRDPAQSFWKARAPDTVTADVETSRGTFTLELIRAWAPAGVDHFYNLARAGYFDDSRFYRVVWGFVAQFGIAGDPAVANIWGVRHIPMDSV